MSLIGVYISELNEVLNCNRMNKYIEYI